MSVGWHKYERVTWTEQDYGKVCTGIVLRAHRNGNLTVLMLTYDGKEEYWPREYLYTPDERRRAELCVQPRAKGAAR